MNDELRERTDPLLEELEAAPAAFLERSESMSKRGPKRTPFKRQQDLEEISRLYLQGLTQREIGGRLGLTRQQITYDIAQIVKAWREASKASIDELMNRKLSELDQIRREAWAAWHASKGEKTRLTVATKSGNDGDTTERRLVKHVDAGDPRFLERIADTITAECELLGLAKRSALELHQEFTIKLPEGFGEDASGPDTDILGMADPPTWPPPPGTVY